MDEAPQPRGSRRSHALSAGAIGALIGAFGGTLIGETVEPGAGGAIGLSLGAAVYGVGEAVTDLARKPAGTKPHAWRIFGAVFFAAALGGAVELSPLDLHPLVFAVAIGLASGVIGTAGLLSFRSNRLVPGIGCGLAAGGVATAVDDGASLALVGGTVALAYRLIGAAWFRGQDVVEFVSERVTPEQAEFVVPFEAKSRRVGADFFRDLAREADGSFRRNAPGIGIVESMESLRGPTFDPDLLDPLVREF